MKIEGQAALVTGGASGLGEATARELARLGAKVAVLDRNAALAEKVAAEIGGVACVCDITDTDSVNAALDKAEAAHGPARILMNVAGIGSAKRIVGKDGNPAPLEDFVRVVNINLIGAYNISAPFRGALRQARCARQRRAGRDALHRLGRRLRRPGGPAGLQRLKGGLVGMTLPMARDLAQHGIRVCTVAPGLFATPLLHGAARGGAAVAGRIDPLPAAPGQALGVRRAGLPHRHQRPPQRRGDPPRRRTAHGAALSRTFAFPSSRLTTYQETSMTFKKTTLAAALALMATGMIGMAHADITIGVVQPLTGPASGLGIPVKNGIMIWPKTIAGENAQGRRARRCHRPDHRREGRAAPGHRRQGRRHRRLQRHAGGHPDGRRDGGSGHAADLHRRPPACRRARTSGSSACRSRTT